MAGSTDPDVALTKKIFWCAVPESGPGSRYRNDASDRAELRLRVLWSLPPAHQRYVFEEIRRLCRLYLRDRRVPVSEVTPEELVSEVWQKLLGTVYLETMNDAAESIAVAPEKWSIDTHAPERDGRVVWLIEQIGGLTALAHRREDIRRQRFGRPLPPEGGPRVDQLRTGDGPFDIPAEPDESRALTEADAQRVWRGLLITAGLEFKEPTDDVRVLLRLMANYPDTLDASSSEQWPIKVIVTLLNHHFSPPPWTDRRVDNAKRRLVNWIDRLMRKNGLDAVDLEGVFARMARQQERNEPGALPETRRVKLLS
jgi:hypothetical protein